MKKRAAPKLKTAQASLDAMMELLRPYLPETKPVEKSKPSHWDITESESSGIRIRSAKQQAIL